MNIRIIGCQRATQRSCWYEWNEYSYCCEKERFVPLTGSDKGDRGQTAQEIHKHRHGDDDDDDDEYCGNELASPSSA